MAFEKYAIAAVPHVEHPLQKQVLFLRIVFQYINEL
jgi:hypothetical protein